MVVVAQGHPLGEHRDESSQTCRRLDVRTQPVKASGDGDAVIKDWAIKDWMEVGGALRTTLNPHGLQQHRGGESLDPRSS